MIGLSEILMMAAILFAVLVILCVLKVIRSKTVAGRMVAFDVINVLVVIIMFVLSAAFGEPLFIDIAVIYTLLSFVATIFIGKYLAGDLK